MGDNLDFYDIVVGKTYNLEFNHDIYVVEVLSKTQRGIKVYIIKQKIDGEWTADFDEKYKSFEVTKYEMNANPKYGRYARFKPYNNNNKGGARRKTKGRRRRTTRK